MGTEITTPPKADRKQYWRSRTSDWTDRHIPDATHMLICSADVQYFAQISNKIQVPDGRGGWDDISPEAERQMPAADRGYMFTVKPRYGSNQSFLEVRCTRFVDREMKTTLLDGLTVYDARDLTELPNPEAAVNCFCLTTVEAERFLQRVRQTGGKVSEAQADLQTMYSMVTQMATMTQELEQLCRKSRTVIDRVAEGVQTDAPTIAERSQTAGMIRGQAAEMLDKIRDEHLTIDRTPGQIEAKGYAGAYLEAAENLFSQIEKLHAEHHSYEKQVVNRIQETLSQSLPIADQPAVTRRFLLLAVVEYYTDLGYDARMTDDGAVIHVDGNVIELGAKPRVIAPQSGGASQTPVSGDLLFGPQTDERGAREL